MHVGSHNSVIVFHMQLLPQKQTSLIVEQLFNRYNIFILPSVFELCQYVQTQIGAPKKDSVRATLNFGKTSNQLVGVNFKLQLRLLVLLEHGWSWLTPRQSRPMCPHKRRALPTTHSFLFNPCSTQSSLTGIRTRYWISFKFGSSRGLKDS